MVGAATITEPPVSANCSLGFNSTLSRGEPLPPRTRTMPQAERPPATLQEHGPRLQGLLPGDDNSTESESLIRDMHHDRSPRSQTTQVLKQSSLSVLLLRYLFGLVFLIPFAVSAILKSRVSMWSADHNTVKYANYIGDASFAVTGSITAGQAGMDLLGCIIVGGITALGGGTIRDLLLLGERPVFWMRAYDEVAIVGGCSCVTFFLWPKLARWYGWSANDEWLFWTDALGVGVFAAAGADTGWKRGGVTALGCAVCGMVTATFGGMTRDVLCQRPPRVLYSTCELYALCGFAGGLAYCAVVGTDETWDAEGILLGTWVGIITRVMAYNHFLRLPTFQGLPDPAEPQEGPLPAPYLGSRMASAHCVPGPTPASFVVRTPAATPTRSWAGGRAASAHRVSPRLPLCASSATAGAVKATPG
eukprot:TRINITY_DN64951_c0_g1_i1.p1 TRINITY_DN64951_c0_g1~~TRINITY_DN64951_c0_g1_i1.p1  ORF type:complete len:446 (+),score=126.80 TRINITY_DN64951_c0_g1_i1:83-1339(+)